MRIASGLRRATHPFLWRVVCPYVRRSRLQRRGNRYVFVIFILNHHATDVVFTQLLTGVGMIRRYSPFDLPSAVFLVRSTTILITQSLLL